jgi:hypothetical protein
MDIELHPGQSEIFEDLFISKVCTRSTAVCARGWGKSFFAGVSAMTAVDELIQLPPEVPNKNVFIIAPTYEQVTDIYHPLIAYQLGADRDMGGYALKHSKDSGRFWFPNNVELRLISYEAIERMRGKGAYFVVNDEVSSWTKGMGFQEAWENIIEPCIITRWSPMRAKELGAPSPGRALTISTPKGFNYLYDMYNMQEVDKDWKSYNYDYRSSKYLDPDEIEKIKRRTDPIRFASEYLASFKDSGNNVFYCFDRKTHVNLNDEYDLQDGEVAHIMIDFNVLVMAYSVAAVRGDQAHVLHDGFGHPDTETLAIALVAKFGKNKDGSKRKIIAYPDPTGRARKTSSPVGRTDFSILESYGITCLARTKSPPIADSVQAVNRKLKTASGETSMYFHPRCESTIKSMERTVWVDKNPDTATIDKTDGVEHWSDGIRYFVEYIWPVLQGKPTVKKSKTF